MKMNKIEELEYELDSVGELIISLGFNKFATKCVCTKKFGKT